MGIDDFLIQLVKYCSCSTSRSHDPSHDPSHHVSSHNPSHQCFQPRPSSALAEAAVNVTTKKIAIKTASVFFRQCANFSVKLEILISLWFENPISRELNYAQYTKI